MTDLPELVSALRTGLSQPAVAWLDRELASVSRGGDGLLGAFAAATRRVGRAPVALPAAVAPRGMTEWARDELARAVLLLATARALDRDALAGLVDDAFRHGDLRERQAVARALPLLPAPDRHLPVALEACRTNIVPLFEAIACENPYPADHFPDAAFAQLALKAVFVGVSLDRVVGLAGRVTDELRRMAADYARERRAAGRSVPEDLARHLGVAA